MSKITAKRPASKKRASAPVTVATASQWKTYPSDDNSRIDEMEKRLDTVEEQLGIDSKAAETADAGKGDGKKPCGCKQTAITN